MRKFCVPVPYQGMCNFIIEAESIEAAIEAAIEKFKNGDDPDKCGNEYEVPLLPTPESVAEVLPRLAWVTADNPAEAEQARRLMEVVVLANPGTSLEISGMTFAVVGDETLKPGVSTLAARLLKALQPAHKVTK